MANKSKKSDKPSKREMRKRAKRELERQLVKAKNALADEKARAKAAAKKAKRQAKKDIKKAKKHASAAQASALKRAKRAARGKANVVGDTATTVKVDSGTKASNAGRKPQATRTSATRRVTRARSGVGETVVALRAKARAQGITGYARLTKAQLLDRVK